MISLKPAKCEDGTYWTKQQVLQEFGFPVLSKEIAKKIELLQNQTEKSKTVRHAIITGETGKQGGYKKNSRMKLPQKWLDKFAGYENEVEGVNYQIAHLKYQQNVVIILRKNRVLIGQERMIVYLF